MLKLFLYSAICIFSIYGFCHILTRLINYYLLNCDKNIKSPYTVLCVKNQAETIEATIRSLAWHILSQSRTRMVSDIVVIDLESTDETFEILIRLAREYEFIHPMSKEQYIELIGNM